MPVFTAVGGKQKCVIGFVNLGSCLAISGVVLEETTTGITNPSLIFDIVRHQAV